MNMDFTDKIVDKCPYCSYEASIKHFSTWEKEDKRGLLGKTPEGFIMFLCPQCENNIKYDPLLNKFFKEQESNIHYSNYFKARDRLRKIAINYLPLWIITIFFIAIGGLSEKNWSKYTIIAMAVLLILRVCIPNIRYIWVMYSFHDGHDKSLRNNILVSFVGFVCTLYIAISVYFSLPYGMVSAVIGFLTAIINGMQGKAYNQQFNSNSSGDTSLN